MDCPRDPDSDWEVFRDDEDLAVEALDASWLAVAAASFPSAVEDLLPEFSVTVEASSSFGRSCCRSKR